MYVRGATDRTGRRVTFSPVPETRNGFRVGGSRWRLRPRPFWRGTVGHRPFLDNVFHGGSRRRRPSSSSDDWASPASFPLG